MSPTDKEYVQRCLDGSPEDYRHLVRRYEGVLLSYLTGFLGQWDRAEEVVQEAFVRAYFSLADLKNTEAFFSWLMGIALRVAKEQQRAQRRQGVLAQAASEMPEPNSLGTVDKGNPGDHDLRRAIAQLPQAYREMIMLRYYGGLSCMQLAKQLKRPVGSVTKTLSRAYVLLREALSSNRIDPSGGRT